ncbi:hypothetical protein RHOFW510R12_14805 [Rhodanobacter sp. FW510-R12]
MGFAMRCSKLGIGRSKLGKGRRQVCSSNGRFGACDRVFELNDRDSLRPCNIDGTVVPDKIGNLNRAGSQALLVSFIETLERDSGKVGRRRQEFKCGARGPRFMEGMTRL